MHFGLVLSHFEFEGFRTVMPALRLRSGQAPAGIQGEQAAACGYAAWIPVFAGMTQHSSTPQNHHNRLLVDTRSEEAGCHAELQRSGGEESRLTDCWMRDSSAYGLSMTGHQNQCGAMLGPKKGQKMRPFFS